MTLSELISELESIRDSLPDDADPVVMLAQQPNWPFEYSLAGVVLVEDTGDDDEGEPPADPVVFLAEGSQLGYLRPAAVSELGWGR